jgi:hypothetical protein
MEERSCDGCDSTGFLSGAALASHKRNICPGYKRRRTLLGAELGSSSQQGAQENYEHNVHIDEPEQTNEPIEVQNEDEVMNFDSEEEELEEEAEGGDEEEEEEEDGDAREQEGDQTIVGEEGGDTPMLNSTDRLIHWIRTCQRSSGLSNRAVDKLFRDVLLHPSFKVEELKVRSAATVNSYEEVMYTEADGWKQENIRGRILHYRDPIQGLKSLFSAQAVQEGFKLWPILRSDDDGPDVYSTPDTGFWWEDMQV